MFAHAKRPRKWSCKADQAIFLRVQQMYNEHDFVVAFFKNLLILLYYLGITELSKEEVEKIRRLLDEREIQEYMYFILLLIPNPRVFSLLLNHSRFFGPLNTIMTVRDYLKTCSNLCQ